MKKLLLLLFAFLFMKPFLVSSQTNLFFLFNRIPEERIIELPGNVKLNYVEQGVSTGIPVIFLHGYTDSWHSFESVLQNLPKNIHAFAISQRGHGNSDRPEEGYTPVHFANDVAGFVKKLNLGPVIVVGHSMGGLVAQRFALDYPELIRGIVIAGSAASFTDNATVKEFSEIVNQLNDPIEPAFAGEFQKSTLAKPISDVYFNSLVEESLKVPARVWKAALNGLINYDPSRELKNINKPALIVWGEKDVFCVRKQQSFLQKAIAGSELLVYPGTGHAVHWEEPKRFSEDLVAFINKLSSSK